MFGRSRVLPRRCEPPLPPKPPLSPTGERGARGRGGMLSWPRAERHFRREPQPRGLVMAGVTSLRAEPRYRLTDHGQEAAKCAEPCPCNQLWVSDGCYQCHECGTIYGVVFGFTVTPRKLRGAGSLHR